MNRIGSVILNTGGVLGGAWLGASIAHENKMSRTAQDAGLLVGALFGGIIAGAITAEPNRAGTVSGHLAGAFHNPEFP